jgi:phytoene synthase
MLKALAVQAQRYYEAAETLLPMIDRDARGALWVMVTIYSGLLRKIDERQGDVFGQRLSVATVSKLGTLLRGAAMSVGARLG